MVIQLTPNGVLIHDGSKLGYWVDSVAQFQKDLGKDIALPESVKIVRDENGIIFIADLHGNELEVDSDWWPSKDIHESAQRLIDIYEERIEGK